MPTYVDDATKLKRFKLEDLLERVAAERRNEAAQERRSE